MSVQSTSSAGCASVFRVRDGELMALSFRSKPLRAFGEFFTVTGQTLAVMPRRPFACANI